MNINPQDRQFSNSPSGARHRAAGGRACHGEKAAKACQDSVEISSGKDAPAEPGKKWTILLYSAGDNDLKDKMLADIKEIKKVGSDENMNLVAQADQGGKNCRRFYLEKEGKELCSLENLGATNMADPKVLADFITWGIKQYPAEHYAVIIADHGLAWKGAVQDSGSHAWMTTPQLEKGLEAAQKRTGEKLDILGFDACFMGNAEVAYQVRDAGRFMVASEDLEGKGGWPFEKILKNLKKVLASKGDMAPRDLAMSIVDASKGSKSLTTLSALDLQKMPALGKAADDLARRIIDTKTPPQKLQAVAGASRGFTSLRTDDEDDEIDPSETEGFRDLGDFCRRLSTSSSITDKALKASASRLLEMLDETVLREQHNRSCSGARGLTMEIPVENKMEKDYGKLQFAKDTAWAQAMDHVNSETE